jgi:DNA uptake protein ComE-like DNA-binding protein
MEGDIRPMPTQSEQKALAFVAIAVLLAGVVRVVRAGGPAAEPTKAEQQGIARQAFAANSAAVAQQSAKDARKSATKTKKAKGPRFVAPKGRDTVTQIVGGVASVPWNDPRQGPSTRTTGTPSASPVGTLIDLDTADPRAIEALPRVGPALASRIVANRDSLGPFGSLDRLRRVKGIGPATIALLRPLVTFSRQARP